MELIILLLFSSRYLPNGWISCTLENLYGMKKWSAKTLYILVIPAKIWGVFSLRADFPLCRHERVSRFVLCECGRWLSSGSLAMIVVGSVRWAADRLRATMLAHIKIDSERLISHCSVLFCLHWVSSISNYWKNSMSTYATRNSLRSIRDFSHAMITDLSAVMGKVASLSSRSNE